jgi:hypothetical protein
LPYNGAGLDVFERDWDDLLILDACRYDMFVRHSNLPGETTAVESRGSATKEFLRGNFHGKTLTDTVYVTASPMLYRLRDEVDVTFHDVINIWKEQDWNEKYRTVLPKTVVEATLDAAARYPNKRLLVHFMQPHYPFIGETGRKHFDLDRLDFRWDEVRSGDFGVPEAVVDRAFKENLREVLPSAERLMNELEGRTVVTADHGQLLGERLFPVPIREYGHPPGLYTEKLVTVPWHVFESGSRRTVVADEPEGRRDKGEDAEEVARERLQQLGYVD